MLYTEVDMLGKKKQKTNHGVLVSIVMLGILASGVVLREVRQPIVEPSPIFVPLPSQFAHLTVDFGDGKRREFRGEVVFPMSALDALYSAALIGGLELERRPSTRGLVVSRIDGKIARQNVGAWNLYVNGELVDANPATYAIQSRDVIEWRYES